MSFQQIEHQNIAPRPACWGEPPGNCPIADQHRLKSSLKKRISMACLSCKKARRKASPLIQN
ncbi:hypothetical protein BDW75DRAFT_226360 [Aspergillus navahoensis]